MVVPYERRAEVDLAGLEGTSKLLAWISGILTPSLGRLRSSK